VSIFAPVKHPVVAGAVVGLIGYMLQRPRTSSGSSSIDFTDPNLYVSVGLGAAAAYAFARR
jgi:hypothetical protein